MKVIKSFISIFLTLSICISLLGVIPANALPIGDVNDPSKEKIIYLIHDGVAQIVLSSEEFAHTQKPVEPDVIFKYNKNGTWVILKQNVDYKVTYKNNIEVGTATVTVEGCSDANDPNVTDLYLGQISKQFEIGHDYDEGEIIKQATNTEKGEKRYSCTVCDYTNVEFLPMLGHDYKETIVKQPTCTHTGEKVFKCNDCDDEFTTTIDKISHNYDSGKVTTKATCKSTGVKTYTCKVCGNTKKETIAKLTTHKYTQTKVVKPTYAEKGYTLYTCSVCNKSYKDKYTNKLTLGTVSGFKASSITNNSLKLTWSKVKDAEGYIIYRYDTSKKTWVRIAKGKYNGTYTIKKLKAGTSYTYAVKAYKTVNKKEITSSKYPQIKVSTNPATVSFKLTAGSKKATVKWSKVTGATGYKVYYKTSKNGKWVTLKTANNKTTSYTKTGLKKGKTYWFTVKAYRNYNGKTYNGSYSTKSVKVK